MVALRARRDEPRLDGGGGAFIALERMLPWKRLVNRSVAVALAVIAAGVALSPGMVSGPAM
jgi:hypothetical protein